MAEPLPAPLRDRRRSASPSPRVETREATADAAKRAFVRMMSHELRTPLNAVIGFSDILASELYGPLGAPQYKAYAEQVRDSGHKLLKLVNQTLEIVRLEAGLADLSPGSEPLEPVLHEAALAFRSETETKGLHWRIQPAGRCPLLRVDARALRSMLDALLGHAVAASPQGGTVSVQVQPADDCVMLEISDQGAACDAAELSRLIRPFANGETVAAQRAVGAGLDLPIARLLAQASGGALRLRSEDGLGLTACLSLPRAEMT